MTDSLPRPWNARLAVALGRAADDLATASGRIGPEVRVDPPALLAARGTATDLGPHGLTSVGGGTRLLPTTDGWLAVCLARPDDEALVPAWLAPWGLAEVAAVDPWPAIETAARRASAAALVDAAGGLGLPVARVGEITADGGGSGLAGGVFARQVPGPVDGPAPVAIDRLRVVDLSSLWAGPLCGALLAAGGTHVTKVESASRPDATRDQADDPTRTLNAGKDLVVLDLGSEEGRARLRTLVASADVVIEGSRPRALRQLGICAEALLAAPDGPRLWISITGFGRAVEDRVAFGDLAAAAGGLVAWDGEAPSFLGDAIADPLTGLAAAVVAYEHLALGGRWLLDASMAQVAASVAPAPPEPRRSADAVSPPAHRRPARNEAAIRFDDVEVDGHRTSVLVDDGRIVAVGRDHEHGRIDQVIDGRGGALLPGLHDHHLHLAATAALARSVQVGPPTVRTPDQLAHALRSAAGAAPPGSWIRAVGYHESVAGDVDRDQIDRLVGDHPVRIQDASGARWTLNSRALEAIGLEGSRRDDVPLDGIERDTTGRPTGRLHRLDDWLRSRLPDDGPLPFPEVGRRLTSFGITAVTDTTPSPSTDGWDLLAAAADRSDLPQRITVTGGIDLADATAPRPLRLGPVKLVIDDGEYPGLDDLAERIAGAHRAARPVAIHCVTRVSLTLALAAFDVAGSLPGDRIEHGSVIGPEHLDPVRAHGLTVVTQPVFVVDRGDRYLTDVDADDVGDLYRCGSLLEAGIRVAAGSDSPHGDLDPWRSIAAATRRATAAGRLLGPGEAITARRALDLYLGTADDPGGSPRRIERGAPADLCLLHLSLAEALRDPSSSNVRLTLVAPTLRELHRS